MSVICYYVRIAPELISRLTERPDAVFDRQFIAAHDAQVIDIDKSYDGLAWLVSPLKRTEAAHNARVVFDRTWPRDEARASASKLGAIATDDALAAIEGHTLERIEAINLGMGGAAHISSACMLSQSRCLSLSEECAIIPEFTYCHAETTAGFLFYCWKQEPTCPRFAELREGRMVHAKAEIGGTNQAKMFRARPREALLSRPSFVQS